MSTFNFERIAEKRGLLKAPHITYRVKDSQDKEVLLLQIQGREASYETAGASGRLQRNFWGTTWQEAGDAARVFVRLSKGWRGNVLLPGEQSCRIKIYRKQWLFGKRGLPGYLQAVCLSNDQPLFTLDNLHKKKWSESDTDAYMQGTIDTSLEDPTLLAALLLAIQHRFEVERAAAAAAV